MLSCTKETLRNKGKRKTQSNEYVEMSAAFQLCSPPSPMALNLLGIAEEPNIT